MERLMFGWDFEVDVWSRFWRLSFIKIFVWTCFNFGKLNSTLVSVVSLAMFFTYSYQFIIAALGDDGDRDGDDKKKENMDMWMHHRSDVAMLLEGEGFIKRCTYTMLQKISIQNPLCQFCFWYKWPNLRLRKIFVFGSQLVTNGRSEGITLKT